jgi:uncharacterized protein YoxC
MRSMTFSVIAMIALLAVAAIVPYAQALTVSTDKTSYRPGEVVRVSGTAPANTPVGVSIVNPNGIEVDFKIVTSDAQGRYSAEFNLPPTLPYPPPPAQPLWIPGTYTVRAYVGAVIAETQFTLTLGGVVTGRVVDEAGNPVADATVLVIQTGARTSTDLAGRFSIETGPGNFTIEISKAGFTRARINVSVSVGETKDLGVIRLFSLEYIVSLLQAQVANLSAQNAALSAQVAALQTQISVLTAQLNATVAQIANLSMRLETLTAEFRTAQAALTAALGDISSKLDSISSDLRTGISGLNTTLAGLSTAVADIRARIAVLDDLRAAVSGLRTDITGLRTDIGTLLTGQRDLSGKIDTLSGRLDTVAGDLRGRIDAASGALSGTIREVSTKIDSVAADLRGRIDATSASVSSLNIPIIVAVIMALLAFVFALLTFLQVRRATKHPIDRARL